jgi:alpha-galactosidase/6-phospho-beta-glucosidase family protein
VDWLCLHPTVVGNLPVQCAALNMSNVQVQGLVVEASFTGDPELVMNAVAMDPLTASVLTLREIREMLATEVDRSRPLHRQPVHEIRRGLRSRVEMSAFLELHQHAPVGLIF